MNYHITKKSLVDVELNGDKKQDFEAQISFYYGAANRDHYAKLGTIKKFIAELGYTIESKRKSLNKKQEVVWTIIRL